MASSILTSKLNFMWGSILLLWSIKNTEYVGIKETYSQEIGPFCISRAKESHHKSRNSPQVF